MLDKQVVMVWDWEGMRLCVRLQSERLREWAAVAVWSRNALSAAVGSDIRVRVMRWRSTKAHWPDMLAPQPLLSGGSAPGFNLHCAEDKPCPHYHEFCWYYSCDKCCYCCGYCCCLY